MKVHFNNSHPGMRVPSYDVDQCVKVEHLDTIAEVQPQLIDTFCVENFSTDDKVKKVKIHSDVFMLFNQTRIENTIGRDAYKQFVENMYQRSGTELPANANFDEIASTIKSRYIQSPSELKSWIVSLENSQTQYARNFIQDYINNTNYTDEQSVEQFSTE